MHSGPTPMGVFISTSQGGSIDLNPPVKPQWPASQGNTFTTNHIGKQGIPTYGTFIFNGFRLNK